MWGVPSLAIFSFVFFLSSGYQKGRTVAAVSAQRPVEHVKTALQNIANEGTLHRVLWWTPRKECGLLSAGRSKGDTMTNRDESPSCKWESHFLSAEGSLFHFPQRSV